MKAKSFQLWPAVDLIDGKPVRLLRGDYTQKTEYDDVFSLSELAKCFSTFATGIHLVDLDGARSGEIKNKKSLLEMSTRASVSVEVGGGIRSEKSVEMLLKNGVSRIILGTSALKNPALLEALLEKYGAEKIVVGVDVKKGFVATHGWETPSKMTDIAFLRALSQKGISTIIYTDIDTDGTLGGPSLKTFSQLVATFPQLDIIASGGVSCLADIYALRRVGVAGVIFGKAFYEGKISPEELLSFAEEERRKKWGGLKKRIIPCLDIQNGRVVKGISFIGLRDAGDAVLLAQKYSDSGADELVFLDIGATHEKRKTIVDFAQKVAEKISIPFTIGGGIDSVSSARAVLLAGADKVAINSAAVNNPNLLKECARELGAQAVVLAIDAKKMGDDWRVFVAGGKKETPLNVVEWAKRAVSLGAGEILLTSIDRDGQKNGFDIELTKAVSSAVSVPVIASGGGATATHFAEVFEKTEVTGALAASIFHFGEVNIFDLKKEVSQKGVALRLLPD